MGHAPSHINGLSEPSITAFGFAQPQCRLECHRSRIDWIGNDVGNPGDRLSADTSALAGIPIHSSPLTTQAWIHDRHTTIRHLSRVDPHLDPRLSLYYYNLSLGGRMVRLPIERNQTMWTAKSIETGEIIHGREGEKWTENDLHAGASSNERHRPP